VRWLRVSDLSHVCRRTTRNVGFGFRRFGSESGVGEARHARQRPNAPSIDPTNDPTASFDFPQGELSKPRITSSHADSGLWARLVSNQRPLACEASALPLSYAPGVEECTPPGRIGNCRGASRRFVPGPGRSRPISVQKSK
jgi:hypothetical protein